MTLLEIMWGDIERDIKVTWQEYIAYPFCYATDMWEL